MNDWWPIIVIGAAPTPLHPEGTRRVVAADRLDRDGAYFFPQRSDRSHRPQRSCRPSDRLALCRSGSLELAGAAYASVCVTDGVRGPGARSIRLSYCRATTAPAWDVCNNGRSPSQTPYSCTLHSMSDHVVSHDFADVLIQRRWLHRRYYDW